MRCQLSPIPADQRAVLRPLHGAPGLRSQKAPCPFRPTGASTILCDDDITTGFYGQK